MALRARHVGGSAKADPRVAPGREGLDGNRRLEQTPGGRSPCRRGSEQLIVECEGVQPAGSEPRASPRRGGEARIRGGSSRVVNWRPNVGSVLTGAGEEFGREVVRSGLREMKWCPYCKQALRSRDSGSPDCPHCGRKLPPWDQLPGGLEELHGF